MSKHYVKSSNIDPWPNEPYNQSLTSGNRLVQNSRINISNQK